MNISVRPMCFVRRYEQFHTIVRIGFLISASFMCSCSRPDSIQHSANGMNSSPFINSIPSEGPRFMTIVRAGIPDRCLNAFSNGTYRCIVVQDLRDAMGESASSIGTEESVIAAYWTVATEEPPALSPELVLLCEDGTSIQPWGGFAGWSLEGLPYCLVRLYYVIPPAKQPMALKGGGRSFQPHPLTKQQQDEEKERERFQWVGKTTNWLTSSTTTSK